MLPSHWLLLDDFLLQSGGLCRLSWVHHPL